MKSRNLTARKLSEEIGYSMNTISSLLTGKIKVHEHHIPTDLPIFSNQRELSHG